MLQRWWHSKEQEETTRGFTTSPTDSHLSTNHAYICLIINIRKKQKNENIPVKKITNKTCLPRSKCTDGDLPPVYLQHLDQQIFYLWCFHTDWLALTAEFLKLSLFVGEGGRMKPYTCPAGGAVSVVVCGLLFLFYFFFFFISQFI